MLASLMCTFLAGCDATIPTQTADAPTPAASASSRTALAVTLLGDDLRVQIAAGLRSNGLAKVNAPPKSSDAATIASAAYKSDFVILVTDATQGPLPIHREHAMILRQLGIKRIGLLFANTEQLSGMSDAVELLELEELELREILNVYDLPGDTVTCFHDTKLPGNEPAPQLILGISETAEWLIRQKARAHPSPPIVTVDICESEIYLMTQEESGHSKSLANGDSVGIFINGSLHDCTITSAARLPLGSSSVAGLRYAEPAACVIGDRFLVIVDGHAVGAGVVNGIAP